MSELPVKISDNAINEIKNILDNKNIPENYGLRMGIKGSGCAGVSYFLGFDKKQENDNEYQTDFISVYIQKKDMLYLLGMQLDYHRGNDVQGFMFVKSDQ